MTSRDIAPIDLETRAKVLSALGDPIRLRVLDDVAESTQCVCDLQERIGIAPNLLSYHLRILREAGLVTATRRGRWMDYRLAPGASHLIDNALPSQLRAEP